MRKRHKTAHIMDMNKHLPAICAFMLTIALFVVLFGNFFGSPLLSLAEEEKYIYLTFDDGPSDRVTPKILDVLKEECVPATFFIVGERAEKRKDIIRREYAEGHTVAIHSYSHKYSEIYSSREALLNDIEKCNDLICAITGEYSHIYRFPGGSYSLNSELVDCVANSGYYYVDWNASFRDSELKYPTAYKLYHAAISTVSNPRRVVMLAHDTTDKSTTAGALKDVIRHFKSLGYIFKKF